MRDSDSVQALSHATEQVGRALHAVPPSSAIPTLARSTSIRDTEKQENASERQAKPGFHDHDHHDAGREAVQSAAAAEPEPRNDHHDNDPGEARRITHPRLAFPSQALIGGLVHPAPTRCREAAAPNPITPEEREADRARARSVLPYAAQVMWGIAL